MSETRPEAPKAAPEEADGPEAPEDLVCDFCGETTPIVRRIALDGEYDRLQTPHRVRYACPSCSERKERDRQAGEGASGS
jgi:hypothetical protein